MTLTKNDINNYRFLLSLDSDQAWDEWSDSVDEDDLDYALELLQNIKSLRSNLYQKLGLTASN